MKNNLFGDKFITYISSDGITISENPLGCSLDFTIKLEPEKTFMEINNVNEEYKKVVELPEPENGIMFDKVIFNGDTTIGFENDNKFVVKCMKGDKFDPIFGFLYAYFLMNTGMSKTQASKFFKNMEIVKDIPMTKEDKKEKLIEETMLNKTLTIDEYEEIMRKFVE